MGDVDRTGVGALNQRVVVVENGFWIAENDGWNRVVGLCEYLFVSFENHMEYDIVVFSFVVMIVAMPVACTDVKLHIASPLAPVDFYFGIEYIGSCIGIGSARGDDANSIVG